MKAMFVSLMMIVTSTAFAGTPVISEEGTSVSMMSNFSYEANVGFYSLDIQGAPAQLLAGALDLENGQPKDVKFRVKCDVAGQHCTLVQLLK